MKAAFENEIYVLHNNKNIRRCSLVMNMASVGW